MGSLHTLQRHQPAGGASDPVTVRDLLAVQENVRAAYDPLIQLLTGAQGDVTSLDALLAAAQGDITTLQTALALLNQPGLILPTGWDGTAQPGWLYCDGSAVSRTTYAALFTAIGVAFGEGDGSTTFNVPDLRGQFLRGTDDGKGTDPDAAGRSAMASGGNSGDDVGSVQADAFQGHRFLQGLGHYGPGTVAYGAVSGQINGSQKPAVILDSSAVAHAYGSAPLDDATNGTPRVSSETRPTNAGVRFYIKT